MPDQVPSLLQKLDNAQSYEEWLHISKQLDDAENRQEWRYEDKSEYYDSNELSCVLKELREARVSYNIPKLLYLVRTTFSRDICNMGDPRLYTQARSGTKYLIEEFINECELVLQTIVNDTDFVPSEWHRDEPFAKHSNSVPAINDEINYKDLDDDIDENVVEEIDSKLDYSPSQSPHGSPIREAKSRSNRDKKKREKLEEAIEALTETRKAFGRTALVFSGGSILGFLHAGVTKELLKANLLPSIISGSSSGSIFASVFCTRRDDEFDETWELLNEPMNIFEQTGSEESFMTHLKRFLTLGTWIDSTYLKKLMQHLIGDITFGEAFNRTGRILNVTVSVAGSHDMPRLLNYLTAPNVVIWSAVVCSCSVPLVFAADSIWAKDPKTKNIYPWSNGHFIDGSVDNDMPLGRLTEMFNVNHFIACQVNPHIAPLFRDTPVEDTPRKPTDRSSQEKTSTSDPSYNEREKPTEYEILKDAEKSTQPKSSYPKSMGDLSSLSSYSLGNPINWVQRKISSGIRLSESIMLKEVEHGLTIMKESGLGASAATVALNVMNQDYWGDINIVPGIKWSDIGHLFKNPTISQISDLVHRGEQATWPKISIIRNHCAVELALDKAIYELNSKLISIVGAEQQIDTQNSQHPQLHKPSRVQSQRTPSPHRHASHADMRRRKHNTFLSPVIWQSPNTSDGQRSRSSANLHNMGRKQRRSSAVDTP